MAKMITAEDALKELDKHLKCSACLKNFKEPKILPCYHIFCKSPCLDKLVTKDEPLLQCPTCRHLVSLPASGVSGFQPFHIEHLLVIQDVFSNVFPSVEKQCGNCKESNATACCYDCVKLLCESCQVVHQKWETLKTHKIVSLDQVQTDILPYTEGVSGFQSDFHLDNLFEIKEAFSNVTQAIGKQCGNCDESYAVTGRCYDCKHYLCDDCLAAHKKMKVLGTHKMFTLDQFYTDRINIVPLKTALPLCPKDSDDELMTYCETCCKMICFDCTVRLHRDHNLDLRGDVFDKHKEEIIFGLRSVREKLDIIEKAMKLFDTRAKEINEQRVTIEADIHKEFDQYRLLDQQRVQLVDKLDEHTQQKLKSLEAQRIQLSIFQVKLTSCIQYAEDGLKTVTMKEVLTMKDQVLKHIEHITAEFDSHTIQPETKADLRLLTHGKDQAQIACQQFGELISDSDSICTDSFISGSTHHTPN